MSLTSKCCPATRIRPHHTEHLSSRLRMRFIWCYLHLAAANIKGNNRKRRSQCEWALQCEIITKVSIQSLTVITLINLSDRILTCNSCAHHRNPSYQYQTPVPSPVPGRLQLSPSCGLSAATTTESNLV